MPWRVPPRDAGTRPCAVRRNRKSGYSCPRGTGKRTKFEGPCPGKVEKSHPIIAKPTAGKKKKAQPVPQPPPPAAPAKKAPAAPAGAFKITIRTAAGVAKDVTVVEPARPAPAAPRRAPPAPAPRQPDERSRLLESVRAARNELGLGAAAGSPSGAARARPAVATVAPRAAAPPPAAPTPSAWGSARPARVAEAGAGGGLLAALLPERAASPAAPAPAGPRAAPRAAAAPPAPDAVPAPSPPAPRGVWGARQAARSPADAAGPPCAADPGLAAIADLVRPHLPVPRWAAPVARRLVRDLDAEALAYVADGDHVSALQGKIEEAVAALLDAGALDLGGDGGEGDEGGAPAAPAAAAAPVAVPGPGARGSSFPAPGSEGLGESAGEDLPRLTKSQRKNLKRAEKKRQKREGSGGGGADTPRAHTEASDETEFQDGADHDSLHTGRVSVSSGAGSEPGDGGSAPPSAGQGPGGPRAAPAGAAPARAPPAAGGAARDVVTEDVVRAVVGGKAARLAGTLRGLGFGDVEAAAAVRLFGADLATGVEWLLECRARGLADPAALLLAASARDPADLDVDAELAQLSGLAAAGVPAAEVRGELLACGGDVAAAAERLAAGPGDPRLWRAPAAARADPLPDAGALGGTLGDLASLSPLDMEQLVGGVVGT